MSRLPLPNGGLLKKIQQLIPVMRINSMVKRQVVLMSENIHLPIIATGRRILPLQLQQVLLTPVKCVHLLVLYVIDRLFLQSIKRK